MRARKERNQREIRIMESPRIKGRRGHGASLTKAKRLMFLGSWLGLWYAACMVFPVWNVFRV